MSVVSKNPFDLLGDDGDSSPAPAAPKAAAPKKTEAAPAAKAVPGSASTKDSAGAGRRGRGAYAGRGGPRNVYREDNGPRNTGPTSGDGVAEGFETPAGFDGERIPNARKGAHQRDAHTKGPRGSRPARNYTSGGHTPSAPGGGRSRAPAQGGERRQFERRSGTLPDSQKKVESGWGADEGSAELTAEVEGLKDAVAEENAEAPAAEAEVETAAEPEEPEEVQKSLDEYLAERAQAAVALGKKEARQVNSESVEGKAFVREGIDEFFSGKEKTASTKTKAKKEKVYIEVDGQFAAPANSRPPRPTGERSERGGGRGGRGGFRGDARGARGGARGGRGGAAPRGRAAAGGAPIDANDQSAFPALGA